MRWIFYWPNSLISMKIVDIPKSTVSSHVTIDVFPSNDFPINVTIAIVLETGLEINSTSGQGTSNHFF